MGTGLELSGKTLGLIGVGDIGQRVALRANAMAMNVLAYDPFLLDSNLLLQDRMIKRVELDEVFRSSDYISIHVPLLPTTLHLISDRELQLMKEDVVLINTSRGGIIDEAALEKALKEGKVAGCALDVFEQEPIPPGNELLSMKNVILTPHTAALTEECVNRMAVAGAERVIDLFNGFIPENVANPEVLSLPRWKYLREK